MRRVVPSEAVRIIEKWFPWTKDSTATIPRLTVNDIGKVQAFIAVVDAVPEALLTFDASDYADFISELAIIRSRPTLWIAHPKLSRSGRQIKRLRELLSKCPDDVPAATVHDLAFIRHAALRASLRLDITHAERAREAGEWKAATVIAGSVIEALLLWKLGTAAPAAVAAARAIPRNVDNDIRKWHLPDLIEVAAAFPATRPAITDKTRDLLRIVKDFRNLIHPGRVERLGERCDRSTALIATAGIIRVVTDLRR